MKSYADRRDQIVLVTGAARGMGAAIAERLLQDGYLLVVVDRDPTVLRFEGDRAKALVADVGDDASTRDIVQRAFNGDGQPYGLVNVAGIHRRGDLLSATAAEWDEVLRVNLFGSVNWTRAVLPYFVEQGNGAIVNFASVAATHARPQSVVYVTSKTAILGFTRAVAADFAHTGVRCNAVSPGSIDTPMIRELADAGGAALLEQTSATPAGRLGSVEEIAGAVSFLLSADAAYMNGTNLVVDGGRTAIT